MVNNKGLTLIADLADQHRLVEITYQKSPTSTNLPSRLIEPYSLTQGKQDIMIRAFQVSPEKSGWKFFMLHKIVSVKDGGASFTPRRRIMLTTGEIQQTYEPISFWDESARRYRSLVLDILADMVVTNEEIAEIQDFRRKNKISMQLMRSVHASIFSNCLIHILSDGAVDDDENEQVRTLHESLGRLGWAPGELG